MRKERIKKEILDLADYKIKENSIKMEMYQVLNILICKSIGIPNIKLLLEKIYKEEGNKKYENNN